jgi:hypothetical protein
MIKGKVRNVFFLHNSFKENKFIEKNYKYFSCCHLVSLLSRKPLSEQLQTKSKEWGWAAKKLQRESTHDARLMILI